MKTERTERTETYEGVKNYLHVAPLGSPEKAIEYVANRIPTLREVKNTSFNLEDEMERADERFYETEAYANATQQIASYSTKGLIWKDIGDRFALERFRSITQRANLQENEQNDKHRYQYKLINHNEPQLNFTLLEYSDDSREVLFNWDFRGPGQDPTVLISKDRQIIEMFSIHFAHLWRRASNDHDN